MHTKRNCNQQALAHRIWEYIPIYKIYFQVNAQRFVGD